MLFRSIGATGSCLEEAGGPESLYVNPDNDAQLTEAILKVLNDDSLREKMIEAGLKYSQKFTRKEVARNIMNVYEKISNLRH